MPSDLLLTCVALNVYHEARGEPQLGQLAVAYVTINRATKEHKDVCSVVRKAKQFSWTFLVDDWYPKNIKAWERAQQAAVAAAYRTQPDPTSGALYYHNLSIHPYWAKKMKVKTVIGQHIFYE